MKSKMPCPPASMPVIKLDQATGLCGGMLVPSSRNEPCSASFEKFGIFPSAMNCFKSRGSMPSMPRMMSFCSPFQGGVRRHEDTIAMPTSEKNAASTMRTLFRKSLPRLGQPERGFAVAAARDARE